MKFQNGDRVKIYGNSSNGADISDFVGTVISKDEMSTWVLVEVNNTRYLVHEKQCRRLNSPKRYWVHKTDSDVLGRIEFRHERPEDPENWICMKQVKQK